MEIRCVSSGWWMGSRPEKPSNSPNSRKRTLWERASSLPQWFGVVSEFCVRHWAASTLSYHCVFPIQRLIAMTAQADTLLNTLEHCDMVEIDGLHAFEFSLDEDDNLHIECIDGRVSKHWEFTPAEVEAATFDPDLQSWLITGSSGEHRLVCVTAFSAGDDEDDERG